MTLLDLINANGLQGTSQQIADALNAKTTALVNSNLQTPSQLIDVIGETAVNAALGAFEQAMAGSAFLRGQYQALNVNGWDFSIPLVQQTIDQLIAGGVMTADLGATIKQLGVKPCSPYEQWAGLGQVVTADQVTQAVTPGPITGRQFSLHVSVTPAGSAVAVSIGNLAGTQNVGMAEAFACSNGDTSQLTLAQKQFVAQVLVLVNNYGN